MEKHKSIIKITFIHLQGLYSWPLQKNVIINDEDREMWLKVLKKSFDHFDQVSVLGQTCILSGTTKNFWQMGSLCYICTGNRCA